MKRNIKNWTVGFIYTDFTYAGLIEGKVTNWLNEMIITNSKSILKQLRQDKDCVNIFEDYSTLGILKPVRIIFELFKYEPQHKAYIITFCDENDTQEQVIEQIINNYDLKTVEWDW